MVRSHLLAHGLIIWPGGARRRGGRTRQASVDAALGPLAPAARHGSLDVWARDAMALGACVGQGPEGRLPHVAVPTDGCVVYIRMHVVGFRRIGLPCWREAPMCRL